MMNRKRFMTIFMRVDLSQEDYQDDPYHLTLTFRSAEHVGYIHLIGANSCSPEIEALEINEEYRRCGLAERLVLAVPRFIDAKIEEIRVMPVATDCFKVSQEEVEEIYGKIAKKLKKKYGIKLTIYHY